MLTSGGMSSCPFRRSYGAAAGGADDRPSDPLQQRRRRNGSASTTGGGRSSSAPSYGADLSDPLHRQHRRNHDAAASSLGGGGERKHSNDNSAEDEMHEDVGGRNNRGTAVRGGPQQRHPHHRQLQRSESDTAATYSYGNSNSSTSVGTTATATGTGTTATAAAKKPPRFGFLTKTVRDEFLAREVEAGRMGSSTASAPETLSLVAQSLSDRQQQSQLQPPLYFWQIYGLTGRQPILDLLTSFYDSVYDDDDPEYRDFRAAFENSSSKKYHVNVQTVMYCDCFGGGRLYFGGERRLDTHHRDTGAADILDGRGARRWAYHMRRGLDDRAPHLNAVDPRIRGAIGTFLMFFMDKYASQFDFDASEIDFGETTFPLRNDNSNGNTTEAAAATVSSSLSTDATAVAPQPSSLSSSNINSAISAGNGDDEEKCGGDDGEMQKQQDDDEMKWN